jgi:hypothetical protein
MQVGSIARIHVEENSIEHQRTIQVYPRSPLLDNTRVLTHRFVIHSFPRTDISRREHAFDSDVSWAKKVTLPCGSAHEVDTTTVGTHSESFVVTPSALKLARASKVTEFSTLLFATLQNKMIERTEFRTGLEPSSLPGLGLGAPEDSICLEWPYNSSYNELPM